MRALLAASVASAMLLLAGPASAEPLLVGVFAGVLPCADCQGIRTELTLVRKASGWAEGRYLLRRTYVGRSARALVDTGEWTTLRGDAVDEDAVVYELEPDHPDRSQHFVKVGEGRVRALDRDLKALPARMPQTLIRRSAGLPSPAAVNCLRRGGVPGPGRACTR